MFYDSVSNLYLLLNVNSIKTNVDVKKRCKWKWESRHCRVTVASLSRHSRVTGASLSRHCRVTVASLSRHCRATVASLSRHCRVTVTVTVTSLSLSWHCHGTVMPLSCHCHATVMSLLCHCHVTVTKYQNIKLTSNLIRGSMSTFVDHWFTTSYVYRCGVMLS
jgi:hypothetical protein